MNSRKCVELECLKKHIEIRLAESTGGRAAGIGDKDIDAACAFTCKVNKTFNCLIVGYIGANPCNAGTCLFVDFLGRPSGALFIS
jgi:hypothetical protein